MKKPEIRPLTSLRFVVAFWVVAYHYLWPAMKADPGSPPWLEALVAAGFIGVPVFFVLSGYVLTYNYDDGRPMDGKGRRRFWAARFARIYPLYLVAFLLSVPPALYALHMAHPGIPSGRDHAIGAILSPLLLQAWAGEASNAWNPPGWTISVEAVFYLLFPLFLLPTVQRRLGLWLCGSLALSAAILAFALAQGTDLWTGVATRNPLVHVPAFLAGMMLARHRAELVALRPRDSDALVLGGTVGLVAVILLLALGGTDPHIANPLLNSLVPLPFVALLVVGLAGPPGRAARALSGGRMVALGSASYGLYILQAPMAKYLLYFPDAVGLRLSATYHGFALFAAALIAISLLAHRIIERPMQRILTRRLAGPRPAPPPAVPA